MIEIKVDKGHLLTFACEGEVREIVTEWMAAVGWLYAVVPEEDRRKVRAACREAMREASPVWTLAEKSPKTLELLRKSRVVEPDATDLTGGVVQ